EIAYCYWREGGFDEARIMLNEALQKLTFGGNTRARALLKLATVEWSASRYYVALEILTDNSSVFEKVTNHTTRGNYHNELAIVLRNLGTAEKREDYFRRAITEYASADHHFKLAHNTVFRADVKNNLAFLLSKLSHFREAHQHLDQARRLTSSVRDRVGIAQIDDTRAQVFIAEKKFKEAEAVARNAVRILERSGQQSLLADALINQAIALARLERIEHAQYTFQKAIEVAHQGGALNKAGLAALTLIEELDGLPADTLYAAYDKASEWLVTSQSDDLMTRVNAAARKIFSRMRYEVTIEDPPAEPTVETLLNKPCDLPTEVAKFEGSLIRQALVKANGSLTRAASQLSMSYQALAYILESRHKDLLKERSPIRRRARKVAAQRSA
ncbi:MAG TPA: helix-turn-helix domain-containing protein, partial [Pyrinomonadaceae bacterium]